MGRNASLPDGLQKLLAELHLTIGDKDDAVKQNDFKLAKDLLNHEVEVRTHLRIMRFALSQKAKYAKFGAPGGPRVDGVVESDITKVVSAWTGIPTTKINWSTSCNYSGFKSSTSSTSWNSRSETANCEFY